MQRTTVMLPEGLKARAEQRARKQGISLGEFIRCALAERLKKPLGKPAEDPLFADDTVFDGPSPPDTATEHDRYLYSDET